jgi:putative ABC transport system permease protein
VTFFLLETFILGVKNLRLHKLRSLLTALGIIFGVAAVIVMVSIGEGAKQSALDQINQLGASNILLRSNEPPESSDASNRSQRSLKYGLTRTDLTRLHSIPGLKRIVKVRDTRQKVQAGSLLAPSANAVGTEPALFEMINLRTERGNVFTQSQYDRADAVCVLGSTAARQLFPYKDPIGQTVQVGAKGYSSVVVLSVIGVLEPTGLRAGSEGASMMRLDPDQGVYFPYTLARSVFGDTIVRVLPGSFERKTIELTEIWLEAEDTASVERLASVADNIMKIGHGDKVDYEVKAPIQILRNAERVNRMFNFIMVGIACFALIVGGIGIMNIMLATVTERTKEIGIRRALGAKQRHITLQFLIETTVISLSGGLIGIGLGVGLATSLPKIVELVTWLLRVLGMDITAVPYPTSVATWSVIGSFIVSGMIGIGFGLYPAIMAARMNPIEALRHE